jgi:hypothetical protein
VSVVLYGCDTLSSTFREEHKWRAFASRTLKIILAPHCCHGKGPANCGDDGIRGFPLCLLLHSLQPLLSYVNSPKRFWTRKEITWLSLRTFVRTEQLDEWRAIRRCTRAGCRDHWATRLVSVTSVKTAGIRGLRGKVHYEELGTVHPISLMWSNQGGRRGWVMQIA